MRNIIPKCLFVPTLPKFSVNPGKSNSLSVFTTTVIFKYRPADRVLKRDTESRQPNGTETALTRSAVSVPLGLGPDSVALSVSLFSTLSAGRGKFSCDKNLV